MPVHKPTLFFAVFAIGVSVGCVRLGLWQLERLDERKRANARVEGRLEEPPVGLEQLTTDSALRFRRTHVRGTYDYANEFVLTSRSRNGAPGVYIITPLRRAGSDTAVLVNRGWAYAPDGMRADISPFREDTNAVVDAFVEELPRAAGPVSTPSVPGAVRRLDHDSISRRLPYPVAPLLLVQQADSGEATAVARNTPVRVPAPRLDEGPHLAYAVQWFAFALVGVVGTVLVVQRDRTRRAGHQTVPAR